MITGSYSKIYIVGCWYMSQDERARKAAAKKAAADRRKAEQDVIKSEGKLTLEKMVAFVDLKVAEKGLIGGKSFLLHSVIILIVHPLFK